MSLAIARTALLGASTLQGKELLDRLGKDAKRLGAMALVETTGEDAVASPIGDDWVVSTPGVEDAVAGAGLVLCCARLPAEAVVAVREASRTAIVVDCTGALGGRAFDSRGAGGATLSSLGPGLHASPAASSLLIAALVRAAARAGAEAPCVAVACEPASELSREALDELYGQAVATLNFQPLPTAVYSRQAVHDVLSPGPGGEAVEARLRREIRELSGSDASVMLLRPGLFHGAGVAVRAAVSAARWRDAMASEPRLSLDLEREGGVSPAGAVAGEDALVGRVLDDGIGGAWAWAAADTLAHGSVGNVVDLVRAS